MLGSFQEYTKDDITVTPKKAGFINSSRVSLVPYMGKSISSSSVCIPDAVSRP